MFTDQPNVTQLVSGRVGVRLPVIYSPSVFPIVA